MYPTKACKGQGQSQELGIPSRSQGGWHQLFEPFSLSARKLQFWAETRNHTQVILGGTWASNPWPKSLARCLPHTCSFRGFSLGLDDAICLLCGESLLEGSIMEACATGRDLMARHEAKEQGRTNLLCYTNCFEKTAGTLKNYWIPSQSNIPNDTMTVSEILPPESSITS